MEGVVGAKDVCFVVCKGFLECGVVNVREGKEVVVVCNWVGFERG